jgi:hypothetical protein
MKKIFIKLFVLAASVSVLTGCFDVKREIKMYPNGGGTENVTVILDKDFFDKMQTLASVDNSGRWKRKLDTLMNNDLLQNGIRADIQRTPGTSLKDLTVTNKGDGSKEITFQYVFDDPGVLVKIIKEVTFSFSNQLPVNFSTIKFLDENGNLTFKYVTRKADRSFTDSLALNIFSGSFAGKRLTQTIDFPFDVKESNASIASGNSLTWDASMESIMFDQVTDTAALTKDPSVDLPYAEKVDRTIGRVSQKDNPLIRVQLYNANKEPVKVGTGIILKDGMLVTNFALMNLLGGGGFFSVILGNDSLAGVDEMQESDLVQKEDLVFLRFNNFEKTKTYKFASLEGVTYGSKVKIFYFPNTLSSVVYSMDGMIAGVKKWTGNTSAIEVKPSKPISLEGGAVFNEAGEFVGMITNEFNGEVGKFYLVPAAYIRSKMK